jgi:hypothetical protein
MLLYSPIKLFLFYIKHYETICDDSFDIRYKVLHLTMKSEVIECLFFNILYLSRRIVYGFVIIFLSSSPYIQVVINSSISIGICFFFIMHRPFKSKVENTVKFYIEIVNAIIQFIIGLFLKEGLPSDLYEIADWSLVIMTYSILILPTFLKAFILVQHWIKKRRARNYIQASQKMF